MEARGDTMIKKIRIVIIGLVIGLLTVPETSSAISPQQLQEMLDRGDEVTIIDIRSTVLYTEGHIPGAISIPSALITGKRLPPIGAVVVYGDGIRTDLTLEAVNSLNTRTGIQADMLEGGFAAWEAIELQTTHNSGFREERLPYLSYDEFEKVAAGNPDIVLVDLRSPSNNLTDLSEAFPGLDSIRLHRNLRSAGKEWDISTVTLTGRKDTHYRRLYVLIDDGNGEAGKVAHRLKAAGIKRMAILTGGEQILRRGGRPGLDTIKTRER